MTAIHLESGTTWTSPPTSAEVRVQHIDVHEMIMPLSITSVSQSEIVTQWSDSIILCQLLPHTQTPNDAKREPGRYVFALAPLDADESLGDFELRQRDIDYNASFTTAGTYEFRFSCPEIKLDGISEPIYKLRIRNAEPDTIAPEIKYVYQRYYSPNAPPL